MAASSRSSSVAQPSTADATLVTPRQVPKTSGPSSLSRTACAMLAASLFGMPFGDGQLVHVLLPVGLMLLMIAGLKALDAAPRSAIPVESEER